MENNQIPSMPGMPNLVKSDSLDSMSSLISPGSEVVSKDATPGLELDIPSHDKPIIESFEQKSHSNIVAPKISKNGLEVVALGKGFYNQHRIKEGDVFIIKSFEELGQWMKCVDPDLQKMHLENIKNKKAKK